MSNVKALPSPMSIGKQPSKYDGHVLTNPTTYRSVVGALQYLTATRLDIAFAINKLCQFFSSPIEMHWQVVKKMLKYQKGASTHGLLLYKSE